MTAVVLRADARRLPLPDASVDLICTSPPYFGLRSYTDGCPTCAATARAGNRGYMERYCPGCGHVFTSGRNKCHKCDLTTLATEKTKAAQKSTSCPDCGGTGSTHYAGQIGSEATPAEWLANLVECTREWVRVLKPSGSIFVNLGDKFSQRVATRPSSHQDGLFPNRPELRKDWKRDRAAGLARMPYENIIDQETGAYVREKSLLGLPWRYALACMDELGLILRRDIIWSKPNGLPESVTDRCRSSHEYVFHLVKQPRYYAAVDEIREPQAVASQVHAQRYADRGYGGRNQDRGDKGASIFLGNPLGKLPGSVWSIPSQPLTVPAHLGVDHFAAFPLELPRRVIAGWSPPGICTACGEGRRPVVDNPSPYGHVGPSVRDIEANGQVRYGATSQMKLSGGPRERWKRDHPATITGYACACPQPDAPTRPAVVLDPFAGTGTTMLAASALGRAGIGCDLSMDYARLARWRTRDRAEIAKAMQVPKPPPVPDGQEALFT